MQKIATNIFIGASLAFGVLGVIVVMLADDRSGLGEIFIRCLMLTVPVILASFAVMVAQLSYYAVRVATMYLGEKNATK